MKKMVGILAVLAVVIFASNCIAAPIATKSFVKTGTIDEFSQIDLERQDQFDDNEFDYWQRITIPRLDPSHYFPEVRFEKKVFDPRLPEGYYWSVDNEFMIVPGGIYIKVATSDDGKFRFNDYHYRLVVTYRPISKK